MKRATSTGSTSPQRSPQQHKKPRLEDITTVTAESNTTGFTNNKGTSGRNAFGVFAEMEQGQGQTDGAGWTKVVKGKKKKARNVENRMSVSVFILYFSFGRRYGKLKSFFGRISRRDSFIQARR